MEIMIEMNHENDAYNIFSDFSTFESAINACEDAYAFSDDQWNDVKQSCDLYQLEMYLSELDIIAEVF